MLKKIVLGSLLVGLVAVLVAGAVNRTNARSSEQTGETGRRGQAAEQAAAASTPEGYGGSGGQQGQAAQGGGRWAQGNADQTLGGQDGVPQADVQPAEWLTIQGTVSRVAVDLIEIRTAAGEIIPFEGRPLSFAQEQGFRLKVGDHVTLAGFDEDGEFKIGQIALDGGISITLRDADGRPGWAGRGRRG